MNTDDTRPKPTEDDGDSSRSQNEAPQETKAPEPPVLRIDWDDDAIPESISLDSGTGPDGTSNTSRS